MNNKEIALNYFGKCLIEEIYDRALFVARNIVKQITLNCIYLEKYNIFSEFSIEQQEKVCNLLMETVMDTIYRFFEMIEEHDGEFKLISDIKEGKYSLTDICEKVKEEIADIDDGWIKQFSKIQ